MLCLALYFPWKPGKVMNNQSCAKRRANLNWKACTGQEVSKKSPGHCDNIYSDSSMLQDNLITLTVENTHGKAAHCPSHASPELRRYQWIDVSQASLQLRSARSKMTATRENWGAVNPFHVMQVLEHDLMVQACSNVWKQSLTLRSPTKTSGNPQCVSKLPPEKMEEL